MCNDLASLCIQMKNTKHSNEKCQNTTSLFFKWQTTNQICLNKFEFIYKWFDGTLHMSIARTCQWIVEKVIKMISVYRTC